VAESNAEKYQRLVTGEYASFAQWVGAGCEILDGVSIGEGSIIAASAVVNKNVGAGTIVGGIPARTIGQVDSVA
jgi:acetyltransferase-like isoleucine patch superfamily enzyme